MALSGDLRTVDLAEILQWIAQGQHSGTLILTRGPVEKRIAFSGGQIASTASTDPRDQLGQFLVREGYLTEQDLYAALLQKEAEGRMLGAVLVDSGRVSSEDLQRCIRLKAEETIYDLFHWREGRFEFKEGGLPVNFPVIVGLDVTVLVFEGARRLDEVSRIREVIPSGRATFTPTGRGGAEPLDQRILALAERGKTLAGIAFDLRRPEFEVASRLFEMVEGGLLTVNDSSTDDHQANLVSTIRTLLERGQCAVRERRFDDAAAAYESVLLLDPLNQNAKKALAELDKKRLRPSPAPDEAMYAVPRLATDLTALAAEHLEPIEGFLLSRINGTWNVRSILKLCPMPEDEAWQVLERMIARGLVVLRFKEPPER